jgi:uncharacterized protein YqgC (DUF456 family)
MDSIALFDMTGNELLLFLGALFVMFIGLVGTILPFIPGVPLIFLAAAGYGWLTDFEVITTDIVLWFGILAAASLLLEWVASLMGVKKLGGTIFGVIGAVIGMGLGLAIPGIGLIGFLVGAFVGAFLMEMIMGRNARQAFKAGLGTFIGFVVGGVMKFVIAAAMMGYFAWQVAV